MTDHVYKAPRDALGDTLLRLVKKDDRIVVLCADLRESLRLENFIREYPKNYIEVGVAEQNMMGIAAGLSLSGKIPFVCGFAAFNPGRNWDQLRVAVCYSKANVKVIGSHAGLSVGQDGATHQALEDIASVRSIPGLIVVAPTDYYETQAVLEYAASSTYPVYIRYGRDTVPYVTEQETVFKPGIARILRTGTDVSLIASGPLVSVSLEASDTLRKKGISAEVIASPSIKPLDTKRVLESAMKTGIVFTAEDHQIIGGLGGAVSEFLSEAYPVPVYRIGVRDSFGESGATGELYAKYGLNADSIVRTILEAVRYYKS